MYALILQGSYNEKMIIYDNYEDALRDFEKHREVGRTCYLTKVVMSSINNTLEPSNQTNNRT